LVVRNSTDVFAVDDQMVARAMQFMAQHGHEPIHVPDVVAALPVTRRSLERRFRTTLGRSIAEEICRLRLERAKRLIVGTNSSICSIAAAAGFCNDNHFNKVFRQSEGMTPGAFRRHHAT
jgi:LacI family transcriptional regulator